MTFTGRFLTGTALLVLSICAFAQENLSKEENEDEAVIVLEPVTVTGYHIKRMDIEGPAPVVVFDRAYFEQSGYTTLQDFARNLPINRPQDDALFNSIGAAGFDLRGIGVDTTLVLVNGLRIAPYAQSAENTIDINSIPVSAIDRVEILKDGASAIYGADAIAGVVNIILRSDFEGTEVSAGYGVSGHDDGEEFYADLVTGRGSGKGNVMFTLSWYDRGPQYSRDRSWSSDLDYTATGGPNNRSQFGSPPTLARYDIQMFEHDPACGTDPLLSSIGASPFGFAAGTQCRFNFRQFDQVSVELERLGAGLLGTYEISARLSFFGDLRFSGIESKHILAPSPMGSSLLIPGFFGVPFVPAQHPDNPFNADGELFYRALDAGNRTVTNESDTYRAVAGLEGLSGEWDWKLTGLASKNKVEANFSNFILEDRFQLSLLGMGGAGGDQWYNPFGFLPQNDPALLDWLTADTASSDTSKEYSIDLFFSRHFGTLPGGPAGFAAGLQYREQKLKQSADELLRSGAFTGGAERLPIIADRDIAAVFFEFSLPLLDNLEAQLALRYEDYSDFGSTTNPKIALRWQPAASLMLRGSYSTSFKPPSFHELFLPLRPGFGGYLDTVRCDITGLPQDCNFSTYRNESSGNPDLEAEDGESWFAGLVWVPVFLPDFELQLDFWKFSYKNIIEWISGQLALNHGADFGILRAPTEPDGTPGRIVLVQETYINVDELVKRGFDTTVRYQWKTERAGNFFATLMHTYIDQEEWKASLNESLLHQNFAGFGNPRNRANLNLSWNKGGHGAAANIHYTGYFHTNDRLWVDGQPTDQLLDIPSHTTFDLQYNYAFERFRDSTLRIGCQNCSDEDPPLHYLPWNNPLHDAVGRFYYIRWQQVLR